MIKHIVFFKLKEENKEVNAIKIKELLENLNNTISEIVKLEVGIDFSSTDSSYDISLYSVFKTKENLEAYAIHPEHLQCVKFIKEVISNRVVVDYQI
jgi:hypothetical protein